ncbi:MAG: helix-turn-helix domain-containing protein [Akkermansiaceae bacterium]
MKSPSLLLSSPHLREPLLQLYHHLPNTLFWVKDRNLRAVWINKTTAHYINLNEDEIIGKTDLEIYPRELALNYALDDQFVIDQGEAIVGKIELLINRFGAVEWRKVTKLPIKDENGDVIGTMGISIPFDNANEDLPQDYASFTHIINHAGDQLRAKISVKELAKFAGMSESTLNRKFHEHLQITPQQLLSQLRIAKACKLLHESVLNISEIADHCGYDSPAAFSRAFKKTKHCSPRDYRA